MVVLCNALLPQFSQWLLMNGHPLRGCLFKSRFEFLAASYFVGRQKTTAVAHLFSFVQRLCGCLPMGRAMTCAGSLLVRGRSMGVLLPTFVPSLKPLVVLKMFFGIV